MILLLISYLYTKFYHKIHASKLGSITKIPHFMMILQPVKNKNVSIIPAFKQDQ